MASYNTTTESMDTATSACVMVLGTQGETRDELVKLLADMGHACVSTNAINGVRDRMAADTAFDLLMIDGSIGQEGLKLIREAQAADPCVRALVYGNGANPTDVVDAIRAGASDYISLPRDIARLPERTEQVLDRVRAHRARERRVADLSEACAKLKATRDEMSERVDTLCGDLASAYRTMREQISDVALASEFRALLSQELDLEAMLRTALEAMMQRIGPINAVVFLQESPDNWGVGAYVNYQWQDRDIMPMLTRLGQIIGPGMAAEHGLVRFDDASEFAAAEGGDMELLNGTEVAAFSCHRGDECLAVFTLFRDAEEGFDDEHAASIDVMRTIVGEQMSRILRVHRRNSSQWPEEPSDDSWGMAA
jgi:DNA-binding response OmpR family regulator